MNTTYTKSIDYYTLITGASEGIGRAMAENCASRGRNLVLVALPGRELEETATYLASEYGVQVHSYPADLTADNACRELVEWLHGSRIRINTLINNAGIGSSGSFVDLSPDLYLTQIQLNVRAVMLLTRLLVDDLIQNSPSDILNVGSLAGFFSIPYKSLYTATKSFVITFTRSLREELADHGVRVAVLCPGPVETNYACRQRNLKHGWTARLALKKPAEVADAAVEGMLRNRPVIIPGGVNRAFFMLNLVLPNWVNVWLVKKEFRKEMD